MGYVDVSRDPAHPARRAGAAGRRQLPRRRRRRRPRWSARTAPARRPCCGSSPATWRPQAGAVARVGGLGRHAPVHRLGARRHDRAATSSSTSRRPPSATAWRRGRGRRAGADGARRRARRSWPTRTRSPHWGDVGGYDAEVAVGHRAPSPRSACPTTACKYRELSTLSGGEQKRLALEALLRGRDEVLLLDEPDNYLDVPGKRWLEERLRDTPQDRAVRQPRPRAARPGRRPGRHRRGRHRLGARRRLRVLPRGAAGAARADGRAAPPLGRGARSG